MKKKKNGFTMIELLAVITIIGILSSVAVSAVTQYMHKAKKQDFEMLEKNLKAEVQNYFVDHSEDIPNIGASKTITAQTLLNDGYLKNLLDPDKNGVNCNLIRSKVVVTRRGSAQDFNMTLDYKVCVVCSKMKSKGC